MILVVGRPGLDEQGRLFGGAGLVAQAAAETGARVELVGAVGDDADGDAVALGLARAGIGHAALLRDPAGTTPRRGADGGRLPRLEAADLELGLSYLTECRVIVIAEPLDAAALGVAAEAASYHGAALVVVASAGAEQLKLPAAATVLEAPPGDDGPFAALIGRYAAQLDAGRSAPDAWEEALASTSWESTAE